MNTSIRTVLIFVWIELSSAQPFWDPFGIFDEENSSEIIKTTTEKPILAQRTAEFNSSFFVVGKSKLVHNGPEKLKKVQAKKLLFWQF